MSVGGYARIPQGVRVGGNFISTGRIWSAPYVSENVGTQAIADLAAGTVIKFGVVSGDDVLDIDANGLFTVITGAPGFKSTAELNFNNTGGATTVASWTELSADGGTTWTVFNTSPKVFTLPTAWDGYIDVNILSDVAVPVGAMFRLKIARVAGGTVSLTVPSITVDPGTGNVVVTGFSARVALW